MEPHVLKHGKFKVEPGKPLVFEEEPAGVPKPSLEQGNVTLIAKALSAYHKEARRLLANEFLHLAGLAPVHLKNPCSIIVLRCADGVVVRYDRPGDARPLMRAAAIDRRLSEMAPILSEQLVHVGEPVAELSEGSTGPRIDLFVQGQAGETRVIVSQILRVYMSAQWPGSVPMPPPPARPCSLLGLSDEMDFEMEGCLVPADGPAPREITPSQNFIAQTRIRLPVGWAAFEVYPLLSDEYWVEGNAAGWALQDVLGTVAQRNFRTSQLTMLDPRAEARRHAAAMLAEFERLLSGPEIPIHEFLKAHPQLLSPTHERAWSKVPFGARTSDFVFCEPGGRFELVEIESPERILFRQDGQQTAELTHALNQVTDWIRYIEDNKGTVEKELGLRGISSHPRSLVVIGRSGSMSDGDRRKLQTIQNQMANVRILTYDDLLATTRIAIERVLGPLGLDSESVHFCFLRPQ